MREIKFRFWDLNLNHFRYDLLIYDSKVFEMYEDYGGMFTSSLIQVDVTKQVVVEQFIGLNDVEDEEIYEGDILKTAGGQVFKVVYSVQDCGFNFVNEKKNFPITDLHINTWQMKIIGNIHEKTN